MLLNNVTSLLPALTISVETDQCDAAAADLHSASLPSITIEDSNYRIMSLKKIELRNKYDSYYSVQQTFESTIINDGANEICSAYRVR